MKIITHRSKNLNKPQAHTQKKREKEKEKKKITPRYIIIKLRKTNYKDEIFKASRGKKDMLNM